jgi:hypothetical protein
MLGMSRSVGPAAGCRDKVVDPVCPDGVVIYPLTHVSYTMVDRTNFVQKKNQIILIQYFEVKPITVAN